MLYEPRASRHGFCDYKEFVSALYNNVKGVQKYQLFSARHANPSVLECRRTRSPPDLFDLRKTVDDEPVTSERALTLFHDSKPVPPPPVNTEKLIRIRSNLRPYVSAEFADAELYRAPTAEEQSAERAVRKSRIADGAAKKRFDCGGRCVCGVCCSGYRLHHRPAS